MNGWTCGALFQALDVVVVVVVVVGGHRRGGGVGRPLINDLQ